MALTDATRLANFSSGVGTDGTLDTNNLNISGVATAATLKVGSAITAFGGIVTATTFSGALSGNATSATSATSAAGLTGTPNITVGNITASSGDLSVRNITGVAATFTGILTYEDVTNVDSTGIVTAKSGLNVVGGGATVTGVSTFFDTVRVGSAITLGSSSGIITATGGSFTGDVDIADKIVHTGDTNTSIRFPAADTFTVETAGSEALRVDSSQRLLSGTTTEGAVNADDLTIATSGDTGITIRSAGDGYGNLFFSDGTSGAAEYAGYVQYNHNNNSLVLGANSSTRLSITSTGGVNFNNGELIERVNITAGKLSDNQNINLDNGMVHLFTTTETATSTPNIISTAGINTSMATGDALSVNIITTTAAAAYSERIKIDGLLTGITTSWNGGSAPSAGGSSGKDFYSYTIIKTGNAAFTVLGNLSNFA